MPGRQSWPGHKKDAEQSLGIRDKPRFPTSCMQDPINHSHSQPASFLFYPQGTKRRHGREWGASQQHKLRSKGELVKRQIVLSCIGRTCRQEGKRSKRTPTRKATQAYPGQCACSWLERRFGLGLIGVGKGEKGVGFEAAAAQQPMMLPPSHSFALDGECCANF
jgi:hypothetical protein